MVGLFTVVHTISSLDKRIGDKHRVTIDLLLASSQFSWRLPFSLTGTHEILIKFQMQQHL